MLRLGTCWPAANRRVEDCGSGQHVALDRQARLQDVAAPRGALRTGMRGTLAAGIDEADLAQLGGIIVRQRERKRALGAVARFHLRRERMNVT